MRFLLLAAALALAACSATVAIGGDNASGGAVHNNSPWPFPQAPRGSGLPPPQPSAAQPAPPEGPGAGGVDFGQWRTAEPGAYTAAFQTQIAAREQGRDDAAINTDLEANGFACDTGARLDCRIETTDSGCALDWYVVVEHGDLHAGFEKACSARGS